MRKRVQYKFTKFADDLPRAQIVDHHLYREVFYLTHCGEKRNENNC